MEETKPGVFQEPPQGMSAIYEVLVARGVRYNRRMGGFAPDKRPGNQAAENNALIGRFAAGEQWCVEG